MLDPRARTVTLFAGARRLGARGAGVGPVGIASNDLWRVYVADAVGDGLLVYRLRPRFVLERRLRLAGEPWAVAADPARYRLYVTCARATGGRAAAARASARAQGVRDAPPAGPAGGVGGRGAGGRRERRRPDADRPAYSKADAMNSPAVISSQARR